MTDTPVSMRELRRLLVEADDALMRAHAQINDAMAIIGPGPSPLPRAHVHPAPYVKAMSAPTVDADTEAFGEGRADG